MFEKSNYEGAGDRVPSANRDLLEQSRLSRLPERKPFTIPNLGGSALSAADAVCNGCGARLDSDDTFQQSIHGCRKCIGIYARIDAAMDEASKRKRRELIEKLIMAAEVVQ